MKGEKVPAPRSRPPDPQPAGSSGPEVYPTQPSVTPAERAAVLGQQGCVVWLTGLSGSGKSTVARAVEAELVRRGHAAYVLDGDNVRRRVSGDLGFSPEDRAENVRRTGEIAALLADAGLIAVAALISPYRSGREGARAAAGAARFLEVFVDTPLEVCARRDPKGLYARAGKGEIDDLTGVSAPYEPPVRPDLVVRGDVDPVADSVAAVLALLHRRGMLSGETP